MARLSGKLGAGPSQRELVGSRAARPRGRGGSARWQGDLVGLQTPSLPASKEDQELGFLRFIHLAQGVAGAPTPAAQAQT